MGNLAHGKVIVGHVAETVRKRTAELFGQELPIVEATGDTITAVITSLAQKARNDRWDELSAKSRAFAVDFHSGEVSAAALTSFLKESTGS